MANDVDDTVLVELSRSQLVTLVGILQLETKWLRSNGDDSTADFVGDIQGALIKADKGRGDQQ